MRGGPLFEELKPRDLRPSAIKEELIRCYEETVKDEKGNEVKEKVSLMYHREIPQFRTRFLSSCVQLFNNWHLFNQMPPNGNGWANERAVTCEILELLERENQLYDAWERDKESAKRN